MSFLLYAFQNEFYTKFMKEDFTHWLFVMHSWSKLFTYELRKEPMCWKEDGTAVSEIFNMPITWASTFMEMIPGSGA